MSVHTIDGARLVAGWDALRRRFGTKSFGELLASAVFYAENGFPLPEIAARGWISQALLNSPATRRRICRAGAAAVGRRVQEPGARRDVAPDRG